MAPDNLLAQTIHTFRIPYDIDYLSNGGCGGTDLFGDSTGDEVIVSVSDSGSAYVRPENPDSKWRIYVDPSGREHQFFTDASDFWRPNLWPTFQDIIECAGEAVPEKAREILERMSSGASAAAYSPDSILDGYSLTLGHYLLQFSGERLTVFPEYDPDHSYYIRPFGIPLDERAWEDCGWSADDICIRYISYKLPTTSSLGLIEERVRSLSTSDDPLEIFAKATALRIIAGARMVIEEVEMFEQSPRD